MKSKALAFSILIVALGTISSYGQVGNDPFVRVKREDGTESRLIEKLITNKIALLREQPSKTAKGKSVVPYSIYTRIKTSDGALTRNGFFRVGDEVTGKEIGWLAEEDVVIWSTRYAISPIPIRDKQDQFLIQDERGGDVARYSTQKTPPGALAYTFITGNSQGSEQVGPFPVAFCVANPESAAQVAAETNQIGEMSLEVLFVLEITEFLGKDYDGIKLYEFCKKMAQDYVDRYSSAEDVPARFGLLVYQDANDGAKYQTPALLCPLTDKLDQWRNSFNQAEPTDIGGDYPEDGLSALWSSVSDSRIGWLANSSKHIVFMGKGAFQTNGKGQPNPLYENEKTLVGRALMTPGGGVYTEDSFGYNTSGRSITNVIDATQLASGNAGEKARFKKTIHVILAGPSREQELTELLGQDYEEQLVEWQNKMNNLEVKLQELNSTVATTGQALLGVESDIRRIYKIIYVALNFPRMLDIAKSQYSSIANGTDGLFQEMVPSFESVKSTTDELRTKVDSALDLIDSVSRGTTDQNTNDSNEFTAPIFELINQDKLKDVANMPVQVGFAETRNDKGRLTGKKVIMVSQEELQLLQNDFDKLYQMFNKLRSRAQRQNVTDILDSLRSALASTTAGQKVEADSNLADLITDLPLRTRALTISPRDIAVMSTRDFESWLVDLEGSKNKLQSTLDTEKFIQVREGADGQVAFVELSKLP